MPNNFRAGRQGCLRPSHRAKLLALKGPCIVAQGKRVSAPPWVDVTTELPLSPRSQRWGEGMGSGG